MGRGKARSSVGRANKHLKLKILVSKFVPWDPEATRTSDLEATRTDLEATRDLTLRQPARTLRQAAMKRNNLGSKGEEAYVERYPPLLPGVW